MQNIEPYYGWENQYQASSDKRSPFYGRAYNLQYYENDIYGYYIHPLWDYIGSDTLYCKILFVDYNRRFAVIELFGEWNDTLHNDIMHFKRNVIDYLVEEGINHYILIVENVINFHGSVDDDYYAEWFEDVEDGWIVALNVRDFVQDEWHKYHLDYYINSGGTLQLDNWRTQSPQRLFDVTNQLIIKRLS